MTNAELRDLHTAGVITAKELQVLELAARGLSDRTIAAALGVSRGAIRERRLNAKRKIRLHSKEAA